MNADDLRDLFGRFGPINVRKMFGGLGLYADDLIFGIVIDGEIFLKVDTETKAAFEAAGSTPFVYEGGKKPIAMPYWRLPEDAIDDPDLIAHWARLARSASLRAPRKSPATKKRARTA